MNKEKSGGLYYDQNCPICQGYSQVFVSLGLLDTKERVPLQQLQADPERRLDGNKPDTTLLTARASKLTMALMLYSPSLSLACQSSVGFMESLQSSMALIGSTRSFLITVG